MSDIKVTALSEETAPISEDVIMLVDDPTGTAVSKKIKLENLRKGLPMSISDQNSNYTFVISDSNTLIRARGSNNRTYTIPKNTSVDFPIGTRIILAREGSGTPTVAGATGVTLVSANSNVTISPQYGVGTLIKILANVWVLFGDIA